MCGGLGFRVVVFRPKIRQKGGSFNQHSFSATVFLIIMDELSLLFDLPHLKT